MESEHVYLLAIGSIFLVGQALSSLGQRTALPRVTLLLLFGVFIGKDFLDLIPPVLFNQFEIISDMTLLMVGFLVGGKLTKDFLETDIRPILCISMKVALFTATLVTLGLIAFGLPADLSIILGCIASATAPAATLNVVTESKNPGTFGKLLVSIVALDDAWGLILFGLGLALAVTVNGHGADFSLVWHSLQEVGVAIGLGIAIGLPAAYLTGRFKPGEPMLTEALGLVFICGGLAIWLNTSFLIASIVMGAVVANLAKHHDYSFHQIENIEWPFMVIFFVLAGASLSLSAVEKIGLAGAVYIICRIAGKLVGARLGAELGQASTPVKRWMGPCLLPQAGVAIGMALVASSHFPQYRQELLTLVIASTVIFELIGPVFTRYALKKASV